MAYTGQDEPGLVDEVEDRDTMLREQLEHQAIEAAERATFHRVEAERWERIGRAALAGAHELLAVVPVAQVTLDSLGPSTGGKPMVDPEAMASSRRAAGTYS